MDNKNEKDKLTKEVKKVIIRNLLAINMSEEEVAKSTNLSVEEVKQLKDEIDKAV